MGSTQIVLDDLIRILQQYGSEISGKWPFVKFKCSLPVVFYKGAI